MGEKKNAQERSFYVDKLPLDYYHSAHVCIFNSHIYGFKIKIIIYNLHVWFKIKILNNYNNKSYFNGMCQKF